MTKKVEKEKETMSFREIMKGREIETLEITESSPLSKAISFEFGRIEKLEDEKEIRADLMFMDKFLKDKKVPDILRKEASYAIKDLFQVSTFGRKDTDSPVYKVLESNDWMVSSLFSHVVENFVTTNEENQVEIDLDVASLYYLKGIEFSAQKDNNYKELACYKNLIDCPLLSKALYGTYKNNPKQIDGFDYDMKKLRSLLNMEDMIVDHLKNNVAEEDDPSYIDEYTTLTNGYYDVPDTDETESFIEKYKIVQKEKIEAAFIGKTKDGQLENNDEFNEEKIKKRLENMSKEEADVYKESIKYASTLFERLIDQYDLMLFTPKEKMNYDASSNEKNMFDGSCATTSLVIRDEKSIQEEIMRYSHMAEVISFPNTKKNDRLSLISMEAGVLKAKAEGWHTLKISHSGSPEDAASYVSSMLDIIENQKPQMYKLDDVKVEEKYKYILTERLRVNKKPKNKMI